MLEYLQFTDLGIPVPNTSENRSAVLTMDDVNNLYLIIFAEGFLIHANLKEKKAVQTFFPDRNKGFPFSSFCSKTGLVYSSAGKMFMVYDPSCNQFTYFKNMENVNIAAWSFEEDEQGQIFFGSYCVNGCQLFSYDPVNKAMEAYGQMDEYGDYMDHLAVDTSGWVYMGVGTEKKGIIAYHPKTSEKRLLLKEIERTRGSAYVHKGVDGKVYGHLNSEDVGMGFKPEDLESGIQWYLFENGTAQPIQPHRVSPSHYYYRTHTFDSIHSPFLDATFIKEYHIGNHKISWIDPDTHKPEMMKIEYITDGAGLSPLTAGPDGKVYGTSNHPMHAYCYDPVKEKITNYGGLFYELSGGGNICAYAVQDSVIGGAAYYGGKIQLFDTSKPINIKEDAKENRNPRLVATHKEIIRPRCAAAHLDQESFIFGGFGENGGTGGGLCIYNYKTGEDLVIQNENLLKYHSTMSMDVLPNGNLIAGTSTSSPCGGKPKVKEAELYIMDWDTKKIIFRCVPVPNQLEISLMKPDHKGLVHGITSQLVYFVFDPESKTVLQKKTLDGFGPVVRDGLVKGEDGLLYGVCQKAIYSIDTKTFQVQVIARPPFKILSGLAYIDGNLYFSGTSLPIQSDQNFNSDKKSHLWRFKIKR